MKDRIKVFEFEYETREEVVNKWLEEQEDIEIKDIQINSYPATFKEIGLARMFSRVMVHYIIK